MRIERLSTSLMDDWITFFQNRAFRDNPSWKSCWCTYFHNPIPDNLQKEWEQTGNDDTTVPNNSRKTMSNREYAIWLIENGNMEGYLAYSDDNQVIGWLNVNAHDHYSLLVQKHGLLGEYVKSVTCFVVDCDHRRKGVAGKLLEKAISDSVQDGYKTMEAYPGLRTKTDSGNFKGPLSLYKKFGFELVKTGRRTIAIKQLTTD